MQQLPIDEVVGAIVDAVRCVMPVVLRAPPGAGKTTGVPPALIRAGVTGGGKTLLIQPRRMAARAAARRLARLLDTKLGQRVGYQVRFDNRAGKQTELVAMTTGVLLRRLGADPLLSDVDCVLLDEFHERSLEADLALGMLQRIRTTFRPELKLLVMSATLDPQPIVDFLGEAAAIESEGRAFPVEVIHTREVNRQPIDEQVADVLPDAIAASDGDVLIFLPGVGEIRRTQRTLDRRGFGDRAQLLELYGDLPADKQDAVLRESAQGSAMRRIILSTNVAETSLTIPGVTSVIDSGLARVMQLDARVGLPKLQLEPISRASAEQRAGRAGRTKPGVCFRLWPAAMHRSRPERELPEIQRSDLSGALLMLSSWGERDPFDFPWLTPPSEEAVIRGMKLLRQLGAVDASATITELGNQMLRFPLHPRLARFMVESSRLGVAEDASLLAALLTERDPFLSGGTRGSVDLLHRLDQLRRVIDGDPTIEANPEAARNVSRVAKQIQKLVEDPPQRTEHDAHEALSRALLAAYPDRVARRREPGSDRGVMIGGRGVRLNAGLHAGEDDLILCMDVDAAGDRPEAMVRAAVAVRESWLDPELIEQTDQLRFDASLQSVVARRRRCLEDLVLSEVPIECPASEEAAELLFEHARDRWNDFLPTGKGADGFASRVNFLNRSMPELDLPAVDESAMEATLMQLCQGRTSFKELASAPWRDFLRGRFSYEQLQLIEKHAPERLQVPSGNSISVDYSDGKPTMRVRIQELYGWHQTPRVAGGKVPVQLHLLGPNHRPQQITEDLENFWRTTYVQVRKDLRGRYPKHHWPEDPTAATATRNGLKPRR